MRSAAFLLSLGILVMALVTAAWRAEANRTGGENEISESQISQLSRIRDAEREAVERLRQPAAVQARARDLAKRLDPALPKAAAKHHNKAAAPPKPGGARSPGWKGKPPNAGSAKAPRGGANP